MLIGHLTDLHCVKPEEKLQGVIDTNKLAAMAVTAINDKELRPECVVVTGDLTHNGLIDEMRQAKDILDALSVPYYCLPGSHDDLTIFLEVFGELPYLSNLSEKVNYAIQDYDINIIVIDTLSVSKLPDVTQTQCAWLNDNLNATKHKPTFVAMHPPPIPTQILVKSEILDPGKNWCLDLKKIIESHPQIDIIACVRNRSSTHTDK